MKKRIEKVEVFGQMVDLTITEEFKDGKVTITHELQMPEIAYDPRGGKVIKIEDGFILPPEGCFISMPPMTKPETVSDREMREMKLNGWIH